MFARIAFGITWCFLLLVANPAAAQFQAQDDFALSFTSGVTGDGFEYPFSIGPSTTSQFGISPGIFFPPSNIAADVGINYLGANLAFFDANNLLTRPSSRISNEAFWTDPRLITNTNANFSLSSLGFTIEVPDFSSVGTIGFDLAIASVAAPLPNALDFQIQFGVEDGPPGDDEFEEEVIFFNDSISFDSPGEFASDVGTFQTLGSPFGGRDARVELDLESLFSQAFASGPGGGFPGDFTTFSGPIFIDIDTQSLDNNNGISVNQVAIDNLSINGGVPNDTRAEPEIVDGPTPSAFNPTIFQLSGTPNANVVNVPAATQEGPIGLSVASGPFTDPGDFRTTLYTPGEAIDSGLSEVSFGFGETVASLLDGSALLSTVAPVSELLVLTDEITLGLTGDPAQAGILPAVFETEALVDAELAEILQSIFLSGGDLLTVSEAFELGLPIIAGSDDPLADSSLYLTGVSANDFLGLLASDDADLIVGTQGATFAPSFNSFGELTGGRVSSFLVTDSSGSFTTSVNVVAVPEPSSLALLSIAGVVFSTRRRRKP